MERRESGGSNQEEIGMDSSLKNAGGTEMGQQEKVKSPEELRFDALVEDARGRSLEGNYAGADTDKDEQEVHQESMLGAYLESGDPEKMAMYKLQELKIELSKLESSLMTLARWDKKREDPNYSDRAEGNIKAFEKVRDGDIARLELMLSELGLELSIPQTVEEARALKGNVVNFENLQKIANKYKAQQEAGK